VEVDPDDALAQALKAFGHRKRLRLLRFVTEPRSLEEIAGHLSVARQSATEHLEQLVALGLVEARHGPGKRRPVTRYVASVPRLFDVYDRLGARIGLMSAVLDEDMRTSLPTTFQPEPASKRRPPELPRLVIVHGLRVGQTIPLQGDGPWLVGRDPGAALCLDYDPYVSHRHAEVRRGGKGFEVVDALSSNGTWVDWQPVARGGAIALTNGSLLRFGRTLVLFRTE
jgi:DNA-binding transcriptional ArsR family regulator